MNKVSIYILKALRKTYAEAFNATPSSKPKCEQDPNRVSSLIYDTLQDNRPCMIARFGSTELSMMVNYLGIKEQNKSIRKYVQGKAQPWWWEKNRMEQMQRWSGFFPPTPKKIQQFCELMLQDMQEVDVLGSWIPDER